MSLPACSHGMPSPASCVTCMEDGPVTPPQREPAWETVATFKAQLDGQCRECDLPLVAGQTASRQERAALWGSEVRYVHHACVVTS